jgi:two-component system cell cycle response regulator DivK
MAWVLLVDDHDDGREVLSEFLSVSGFDVEGCASGEAALECIAVKGPPGVVVTDLTLGEMSGVDLAKKLQADDKTKAIPVVAVTGHVGYDDPDGVFTEVLPKPVPLPKLVETVKRALAG